MTEPGHEQMMTTPAPVEKGRLIEAGAAEDVPMPELVAGDPESESSSALTAVDVERAAAVDDAVARWARQTAREQPAVSGVPDTREGIQARGAPGYAPPDGDQPHQADPQDYARNVRANTRVAAPTAPTDPPAVSPPIEDRAPVVDSSATTLRAQLDVAQRVATAQARQQQVVEVETGERIASTALGQYAPPTVRQGGASRGYARG